MYQEIVSVVIAQPLSHRTRSILVGRDLDCGRGIVGSDSDPRRP